MPQAITDQLRRRGVDVLTAVEDGYHEAKDEELLVRAHQLGRVVFTSDIGFKSLAEDWQRSRRPFSGLADGHQLRGTIGQYVRDLATIALASEQAEWANIVVYLPL